MAKKGLMIDYEYCTGCHSCEVACKQEHDYPVGKGGIHLNEIITPETPEKRVRIDYLPFPTVYCDLCAARTKAGELPACVKHCQASVMSYGNVTDLAKVMDKKSHYVLFTPK